MTIPGMDELLTTVKALEKLAAEHRAVKQHIGEEQSEETNFFNKLEDEMRGFDGV
jgi:hypothetical protein